MIDPLHPRTRLVGLGRPHRPGDPLNHPVTPASNFLPGGEHWYSRLDGTNTIDALEEVIGALEGGTALVFGSGMAAVAAVLSLVPAGGKIAAPTDCYHGVAGLLTEGAAAGRWDLHRIEPTDTAGWAAACDGADLVWLESPSNPLLEISDLPAICRSGGRTAIVGVDSTFATPLGQRPLELGADLAMHSVTKFMGGHSDLLAGAVVTRREDLATRLQGHRQLAGAVPGALEAFLALRGLRTLSVRLDRQQSNAGELARRLEAHPAVRRVRYPGLVTDPGHTLAASFMDGYGAVISFEVADDDTAAAVVEGMQIVTHATSLGGVESTAERRSGYPGSTHLPPGLIRMSVGIEHVDDLWDDLARALAVASA